MIVSHFAPSFQVALLAEGVDRNCTSLLVLTCRMMSPSSQRAWIEIFCQPIYEAWFRVALLAEGVDRNMLNVFSVDETYTSPSSQRAWIEILTTQIRQQEELSPSSQRAWIEMSDSLSIKVNAMGRPPRRGRG